MQARWHRFMQRQQVGKRLPVIIDEPPGTLAKGRSRYGAPDIDGSVHIQSRHPHFRRCPATAGSRDAASCEAIA